MKFKLFIFCLFFCLKVSSQTSNDNAETSSLEVGLSKEELTIACDEYKRMIQTDAYLEHEKKQELLLKNSRFYNF